MRFRSFVILIFFETEPLLLAVTEECAQLQKQVNELNLRQARLKEQTSKIKSEAREVESAVNSHRALIENCER